MKKGRNDKIYLDDHVGCFGDFNIEDPVCKSLCALRMSCCIEREQNVRSEILEDLIASDDMFLKIH